MGFPSRRSPSLERQAGEDGVATIETEAEQDGRRIIRKGKAEVVLRL
jgi:hypothetical protein